MYYSKIPTVVRSFRLLTDRGHPPPRPTNCRSSILIKAVTRMSTSSFTTSLIPINSRSQPRCKNYATRKSLNFNYFPPCDVFCSTVFCSIIYCRFWVYANCCEYRIASGQWHHCVYGTVIGLLKHSRSEVNSSQIHRHFRI